MYNQDHNSLSLFPSATCNLKCKYCNIEKNEHLKKIDQLLEESFLDPEYYFQQIKKYFPYAYQLKSIDTWGGEPFLHIERIYPLLKKVIPEYPYFTNFFSSTNFSLSDWPEKVIKLLQFFAQFDTREFVVELQLSMDGPEYINDENRGIGTTQKCLKNYQKLINKLSQNIPSNVYLLLHPKPTLDLKNIKELNSSEKIYQYYLFFEKNMFNPLYENKDINHKQIRVVPVVPNMAAPMPATKIDGEIFAQFLRNSLEVEKQQRLKYYTNLLLFMPFSDDWKTPTCHRPLNGCQDGVGRIGLLPNNLITTCNEGFLYIADNYLQQEKEKTDVIIKSANQGLSKMCLTASEYKDYQQMRRYYLSNNTTSASANTASYITLLAMCGQVDKKYLIQKNATQAANYILTQVSFCWKDNVGVCGSRTLVPDGHLKLLLNGALDIILGEIKND